MFESPEPEEKQKTLFREKLYEQLKKAGINTEPPQPLLGKKTSVGGVTYQVLKIKCKGKCKFDQFLDFLANLKENPYVVGVEELQIRFDTKEPPEKRKDKDVDVDLIVSTFVRDTASKAGPQRETASGAQQWRRRPSNMQIRTADKNRERISLMLVAAAVLLGTWACAKVAGFYVQRVRMQRVLTVAQSERDPNSLKQSLGQAKKAADSLKKSNLFVKTPPKQNPVKQVEGILGSEAFIAGKWYKVGDKIADAKIVTIGATKVEVEWDGKKTSFSPIGAASAGPPAPPIAAAPKKEAGPPPAKPPEAKVVKAAGAGARRGRSARLAGREAVAQTAGDVPRKMEQCVAGGEGKR